MYTNIVQEDLLHGLSRHGHETLWPVVSWVFLHFFLEDGSRFPFSSLWRLLLTAMTFQNWWKVARQPNQPVTLEHWGACRCHFRISNWKALRINFGADCKPSYIAICKQEFCSVYCTRLCTFKIGPEICSQNKMKYSVRCNDSVKRFLSLEYVQLLNRLEIWGSFFHSDVSFCAQISILN